MSLMGVTVAEETIRRELLEGAICLLTFDRPESGANIFDATTLRELDRHLEFVEADSALTGLVIASAKKSIFIAGADLKTLLRQAQTGELREFIAEGQRVFNRLAALQIPTCAAIHGACAGGGYEVTLACDWRVATAEPATRIGLPETALGLLPAWGGCTRLPRLIGATKAAEVILKGKLYSAAEAKELGLVDEVVAHEQLIESAKRKLRQGKRPSHRSLSDQRAERDIATDTKSSLPSGDFGNAAPARARQIINNQLPVEESLSAELNAIVELGATDATQNLIRNFFLSEKYKKRSSGSRVPRIAHAAVIGAGLMGSGIAQWLSSRGVSVILRDVAIEQLKQGLGRIDKVYADAVKRGLMTEVNAAEGRARVVASTAPVQMRDVEVVIEAASEKLEVKKQIFRGLAETAPNAVILATNTSALPISDLAAETNSPGRVIGLHFFNPVSRMKLVEAVVGEQTGDDTVERALEFVKQIGKLPIVVRDSPGFLVNRVLFPYLLEAAELFENGLSASEIDETLVEWGMPMGPLRLIDEIGIDITVDIARTLESAYGPRDRTPNVLREMQATNLLGRKSGAGFYKYEGKSQAPNSDLQKWRKSFPTSPPSGATTLANRLVFLMVNEAARCLEDSVVRSPEDADYGMILGTGFAPFRGGPLRFAENFGIRKVCQEMQLLAEHDAKFSPAAILKQHAQNGTTFYENTARSASGTG